MSSADRLEFSGFLRPDGTFGVRNYLAVVPTVACACDVVLRVSEVVVGARPLMHHQGCAQLPQDVERVARVLANLGKNPNVGAVLVVGLGCESVSADRLADEISKTGKPVETVVIQEEGGTRRAIARGVELGQRLAVEISECRRTSAGVSELAVGVKCGASDATSGIASNPAVGACSDALVDRGATVIFGETTEIIGAEHILAKRAASREVAERLLEVVRRTEERIRRAGVDIRGSQPTPGNIAGGITTLEEKSLGAIAKGGSRPLAGVLEYGERPEGRGLYFMDTPGREAEAVTGLVAGGAQVVLFTTGRGAPQGFPIAPVVKVCGNPRTCKLLGEHIDVDVSGVIEGGETVEGAGRRVLGELLEVASGKPTRAELLGCDLTIEIYAGAPI